MTLAEKYLNISESAQVSVKVTSKTSKLIQAARDAQEVNYKATIAVLNRGDHVTITVKGVSKKEANSILATITDGHESDIIS